jgi:hypothetical protein
MSRAVTISAVQAIAEANASKVTVYSAFQQGRIRGFRDNNGRIFFDRESFNEWRDTLLLNRELRKRYRDIRSRQVTERRDSEMAVAV